MMPGTHGRTFGGKPLAMAVARKTVETVADESFLVNASGSSLDT